MLSLMDVPIAKNDLHKMEIYKNILEFTLGKNHLCALLRIVAEVLQPRLSIEIMKSDTEVFC